MKTNNFVVNANLLKRSGAAILDFIMFVLLSLTIVAYIVGPIYDNTYQTSQLSAEFLSLQKASYLYVEDTLTDQILLAPAEDHPEAVYNYYAEFKNGKVYLEETQPFVFSITWYNETILKVNESESLFVLVDETPTVLAVAKTTATPEQLATFYNQAFSDALADLATYEPYLTLATQINGFFIEILIIAFTASALIIYFVIPLLIKGYRTLGKLALGIVVVTKDGFTLSLWQKLFRFIVLFATFVTAIYTIFGSILLSYTLMIFSKNYRSFHDFASLTRVVDLKQSLIFPNQEALNAYETNLDQQG
jgi:uncharacterized RDD family membrane protein YckC